jgi:hypothetical protein
MVYLVEGELCNHVRVHDARETAFTLAGGGLARPNALHNFVVGGQGFEVVHGLKVEPGDGVASEIAGESLGSVSVPVPARFLAWRNRELVLDITLLLYN